VLAVCRPCRGSLSANRLKMMLYVDEIFFFQKCLIFWLTSPSSPTPSVLASSLPFGQDIVCSSTTFLSTSHESFGIIILLYMSFSLPPPPTPPLPILLPPLIHTRFPPVIVISIPPTTPTNRPVLVSLFLVPSLGQSPLLLPHVPYHLVLSPSHSLTLPPPQPLDRGFVSTSVCLYVLGAYVFEITELKIYY
jgi:hypothetical protein